eukprot:TRINITY_DN3123_c0_g1_i1.p1 TRINITY_DN3123_c0_g1~~TRINITY_DN3123_c0_g1_i1.p1  ORF type:complete len:294 (-),score=52.50 TRINITY_DN3123_c0_g1_i1:76-957(-)
MAMDPFCPLLKMLCGLRSVGSHRPSSNVVHSHRSVTARSRISRRSYGSDPLIIAEETSYPNTFEDPRPNILEAALKQVKTHGWSKEALSVGAETIKLPSITHGVFPEGEYDLVNYFVDKSTRDWVSKIPTFRLEEMTPKERLKKLIQTRLEYNIPYMSHWPQAMAILAHPTHLPQSLHHASVLVDEILHQAGDRSVNFDWYTKRAGVLGIYTATELYMITDTSRGFESTWSFLDRRIDDMIGLGTISTEAGRALTIVGNGVASQLKPYLTPTNIASAIGSLSWYLLRRSRGKK